MTTPNPNLDLAREQEENLIGALLKHPEQIDSVGSILSPDDFYMTTLGWAFGAMLSLRQHGLNIDSVTLGDELERSGKMPDFGIGGLRGRIALTDLRTNFKGDNPESYASKVLSYSAKRKLVEEAGTLAYWSLNGREAADIQSDMIQRISDIKVPNAKADKHTQTFAEALSVNYDEVNNGNVQFVPTGFYDLDLVLSKGLYAPDFMIIAGRPGKGKTSLLLSIAMNAAKMGKRVVMFSLEMSNSQVVMRSVSMEKGIPFGAMRSRTMTDQQKRDYNNFVETFETLPLHLNDLSAISVNTMRQTVNKIKGIHGKIDLIMVDYIQLAGIDGEYGNREAEVSSISRGLKMMAKEFDVPVLAAAQLSRALEKRSEKKPILSDLRESGSLEQDSDIVGFIHVEDEIKNPFAVDLIIAKHRNGGVGSVPLTFRAASTKFESRAR